jgi:hypothetical protein
MEMSPSKFETEILDRLADLEKKNARLALENRLFKVAMVALLGLVCSLPLLGTAQGQPQKQATAPFEIKDKLGHKRIVLCLDRVCRHGACAIGAPP